MRKGIVGTFAAAALLFAACQSPTLHSNRPSSSVRLVFLVSGASAEPADSASRLLLPSAATLTVSMVPTDPLLPSPAAQSAPIAPEQTQVGIAFSNVEDGSYTVSAVASDASGVPLFQQSSLLTVARNVPASVTLNLVPVVGSGLESLQLGLPVVSTLAAGRSVSFTVPRSAMTSGAFRLKLIGATHASIKCYIQDQNGAILSSNPGAREFVATPAGPDYAFVTLYNPDAEAVRDYDVEVAVPAEGTGAWTPAPAPEVQTVVVSGGPVVYFGNPTVFSATYSGAAASRFDWYIDGVAVPSSQVSSTATASSACILPTAADLAYGAHTLTATATDAATGIVYSSSAALTATNNVPATSGLVGEWLFAGNALDTSGYACSGTVSGATATPGWGDRTAYAFASGNTVTASDPNVAFGSEAPFSVSLRFRADASILAATNYPVVLQKTSSGYFGYFLRIYAGTLFAGVERTGSGSNGVSAPLSAGVWYHAVLSYDGSVATLYLDGAGAGTAAYSYAAAGASSAALQFGGGAAATKFVGAIQDCRVYNRALGAAEVAALYNE